MSVLPQITAQRAAGSSYSIENQLIYQLNCEWNDQYRSFDQRIQGCQPTAHPDRRESDYWPTLPIKRSGVDYAARE